MNKRGRLKHLVPTDNIYCYLEFFPLCRFALLYVSSELISFFLLRCFPISLPLLRTLFSMLHVILFNILNSSVSNNLLFLIGLITVLYILHLISVVVSLFPPYCVVQQISVWLVSNICSHVSVVL